MITDKPEHFKYTKRVMSIFFFFCTFIENTFVHSKRQMSKWSLIRSLFWSFIIELKVKWNETKASDSVTPSPASHYFTAHGSANDLTGHKNHQVPETIWIFNTINWSSSWIILSITLEHPVMKYWWHHFLFFNRPLKWLGIFCSCNKILNASFHSNPGQLHCIPTCRQVGRLLGFKTEIMSAESQYPSWQQKCC